MIGSNQVITGNFQINIINEALESKYVSDIQTQYGTCELQYMLLREIFFNN